MKHIVSYSGGLGSAITADIICDLYGRDNTLLLFADTLVEDPDLYRFNEDIKSILNCNFISISEGRTPWEVFNDVKYIGNTRIDPCSRVLKRELILNWLKSNYKPEDCTIWIGIDCSEEHRLAPVVNKNKPYNYRSILIESGFILTNQYKKEWCIEKGIKIPRLYEWGFAHNNCGGFCVKAGLGQFKKLYQYLPEIYLKNEQEELNAISNNSNLKPFLRKMVDGKVIYLTMREYRLKYLDKNTLDEDNEFGGCGCAL